MKIKANKCFAIFPTLIFLVAAVSMNSLAFGQNVESHAAISSENNFDHGTLARKYESLAKEMGAKVEAQKDIFKHKPSTSYFGKNGRNIKSHVGYKIHRYEESAAEYLKKATYHKKIAAEQNDRRSASKLDQTSEQINKTKKAFDKNKDSL